MPQVDQSWGSRQVSTHYTSSYKADFLPEQTQPLWFCGLLGDFLARDSEISRPPEETVIENSSCKDTNNNLEMKRNWSAELAERSTAAHCHSCCQGKIKAVPQKVRSCIHFKIGSGSTPGPIERRMDSVFHKLEIKIWAGNLLSSRTVPSWEVLGKSWDGTGQDRT